MSRGESPEKRLPELKNRTLARRVITGLVNQKNTIRSITVLIPSANAKPLTTPIVNTNSTTAASSDTESAARQVFRARAQPVSTATRIDLPARISSRIRSKYTMNESAVMPTATIRPAIPGRVRVNPEVFESTSTMA